MPDLADEAAWKAELDALASSNAAMATLAREQVAAWLLRHRNDPDLSSVDVQRLATIAGVCTDKAAGEQGPGSETGCCEEEFDLTDAPEAEIDLWRVARDADGKAETVTERRLAAGRFAPAVPGTALGAGLVGLSLRLRWRTGSRKNGRRLAARIKAGQDGCVARGLILH